MGNAKEETSLDGGGIARLIKLDDALEGHTLIHNANEDRVLGGGEIRGDLFRCGKGSPSCVSVIEHETAAREEEARGGKKKMMVEEEEGSPVNRHRGSARGTGVVGDRLHVDACSNDGCTQRRGFSNGAAMGSVATLAGQIGDLKFPKLKY
uniref:Uncharacterized protein n=1 Tax=Oryza punctata TaxID=4537 RepID=A0A0E0K9I7_ORYPU